MAYDYYGRWVPDNPNGWSQRDANDWSQRSRQSNPPPGYSSYGQQPNPGAYNSYGQQPAGLTVTPRMYHADIVPIKSEADVHNDIVPPTGEPRMYMSEDDRLIATKRVGPNGVEEHFYDLRPPAPPAPSIDPQTLVLRSEIDGIVNRIVNQVIDERIAQSAEPPAYEQPAPPPARAASKPTGGGKSA